jgi:serine/threonine protein kinase
MPEFSRVSAEITTRGVPFGRYRLIERLGVGGMAIVYRAVVSGPKNFSRTLVIKRVIPHLAHDPSFVTMLAAEARLAGLLLHPNIVQVHEFGDVDGEYYLAMELVDGFDLNTILRQARQLSHAAPPGLLCYMMSELAGALAYAHSLADEEGRPLEIVHRDVTPSNVMVTRHGGLKLVDFGIAKASTHAREERTRTGTLKGKLSYMSPEQIQGLNVDGRTDIFALGVVFYECLTLRRLFKADTDAQTIRNVCDVDIVRPSVLTPGIDAELESVVMRMLARNTDDRYSNAHEIVAALAPIARRLGGGDAAGLRQFLEELQLPLRSAKPLSASDAFLKAVPELELEPDGSQGSRAYIKGELVESAAILLPPSGWRRRLPVIGGAAVGAVVAMALLLGRGAIHSAPDPAATNAPVRAAAALPSTGSLDPPQLPPTEAPRSGMSARLAAPATVRLRVSGTDGADVVVDGVVLGQVPLDVELARKAGPRSIQVRKAGFSRYRRDVEGDAEAVLSASLTRVTRAPAKKAKSVIADPFADPR